MKSHMCNGSAKCDAGSETGLPTCIPRGVDKCDTTLPTQAWLLFSVYDFWIGLSSPVSLLSSCNLKTKMEIGIFCLHLHSTPPPTFLPLLKLRHHAHILIVWVKGEAESRHLHTAHFSWMLSCVLLPWGRGSEAGVPLKELVPLSSMLPVKEKSQGVFLTCFFIIFYFIALWIELDRDIPVGANLLIFCQPPLNYF